jgi:hypothetical protein
MKMEQPQFNIDLKNTTGIQNSEGGSVFQQGLILRKISKFIAGTPEDAILPIPVFYDPHTFKIFAEALPKELREELKDESI